MEPLRPTPPPAGTAAAGGAFGATVRRPIGLLVVFTTMLVVGAIAYLRIPLQLMPSGFADPGLWIWIPNPGASARENEEKVARPVEEQLRTLAGIEQVRSNSEEGLVQMRVAFDADLPVDLMKAEVRDRLERARPLLPDTVEDIGFWSEDADQLPVSWFGVLHGGDSDRTDFLLNEIVVPRLEAVDGVSQVDVFGDLADSVRILLDEDRVAAAKLDIGTLVRRLSADNFAQPMGEIDDGGRRTILRSDMRFRTLEEIERYPLGDGLVIGDVAEVIRAKSVRDQLSRIDGDYSYFGIARKESQANVVSTSRALVAAFEELERDPRLEGEISFLPFFVQGKLIENSLEQLRSTALWGGGLAIAVLFVFLRRVRLTLCVALAIPVSALMAIAWEFFAGGSFNVLTMVGVTLAIGMLVDNAVVVVENIARRRADGEDAVTAAIEGVREIALAVSLATLTTVVVFLPLIFMSGNPLAKVIFGGIGIPLSVALMFSLAVAVVFLPAVAARVLGERPAAFERLGVALAPLGSAPTRMVAALVGLARVVSWAVASVLHGLNRTLLALLAPRSRVARGLALAILVAIVAVVAAAALAGLDLLGEQHRLLGLPGGKSVAQLPPAWTPPALAALFALGLLLLPGALAARRRARPALPERAVPRAESVLDLVGTGMRSFVAWAIEHRAASVALAVLSLASIAVPMRNLGAEAFSQEQGTDSVRYYVDFDTDFTLREAADEIGVHERFLESLKPELGFDHWSSRFNERGGSVTVYWDEPVPPTERKRHERRIREEAPRPPGHRVRFADADQEGSRSAQVASFELRGPDSEVLAALGVEAERILAGVEGLGAVRGPLSSAPNQLRVQVDRDQAISMGVDSNAAVQSIAWTLRGFPLPRFQDEGREVPLLIEFDAEQVAGISTLKDLQVFTPTGQVPLASFSDLSFEAAPTVIRRVDGQTTFTLTAEVDDPARATELTEAGYAALQRLELPRGYTLGTDSSARARQQEEFDQMGRAFMLSVVLVFLLMGILFESVTRPFAVLFTIPFAVLGAIWTLFLVGTPMDVLAWIGLIILAGVVVNNGIVLIDRIHKLRDELEAADPSGLADPLSLRTRAIVEGTGQRVRPVLMTALTTIFGLLPMIVAEPATDAIDYRGLATIVAGGLGASTFFTLWVVPLAYSLIDDLAASVAHAVGFALGGKGSAPGAARRAGASA